MPKKFCERGTNPVQRGSFKLADHRDPTCCMNWLNIINNKNIAKMWMVMFEVN